MSTVLYDHQWMKLHEDDHGEAFVTMGLDAVVIVALTDNRQVLFVYEKSIAYQTNMLILPMGGVEPNEYPEITVNRELQEETGYRAGSIEYVGSLHPSVKYLRWKCQVYLARDLVVSHRPGDETSPIVVNPVPVRAISRLIGSGELSDSTSIAALYLVGRYMKSLARVN